MISKILGILKSTIKLLLILMAVFFVFATIYFSVDFLLKDFLSFSLRAVLSNFIVFALIIFFEMKQVVHPQAMLEQEQTVIENQIKASETAKEESENRLTSLEESMSNIDKEIDDIILKSEQNVKLVGAKVLEDAEKTSSIIKDNVQKAIENSRVTLKNDLIKRVSLASVEVAKNQILGELERNTELHDKLIEESINALEGTEL